MVSRIIKYMSKVDWLMNSSITNWMYIFFTSNCIIIRALPGHFKDLVADSYLSMAFGHGKRS